MIYIDSPRILDDNTMNYLDWLVCLTEYSDPGCKITFRDNKVVITPNNRDFRQSIIDNVLHLHHRLKIPITYSKSLAISKIISFDIE